MSSTKDRESGVVGVSLKLHLTYRESQRWLNEVRARASRIPAEALFVLPSFPLLPLAAELFSSTGIRYGAQNAHSAQRGAFTGEVSPVMLSELGCTYVEVGHAERRNLFGETDSVIAAKTRALAEVGLVPILCVGEQQECDPQQAIQVVRAQIDAALADFPESLPLVVAYEPVWAIGVGEAASPSLINAVIGAIRGHVKRIRGGTTTILYGGSASSGTFSDLLTSPEQDETPDGLFLGRAAHDVERLVNIVDEVTRAPSRSRTE